MLYGVDTTTSWPISRLLHYQSCCSHVSFFRVAALKLLSKIKASDSDHPCLTRVAEAIVHGRPVSNDSVSRMKMNSKCTRLIVPYHPSLGGLNAMLFSLQPLFVAAGFQDMAPKMVWSLSGKSIHLRMLADTRTKLGL